MWEGNVSGQQPQTQKPNTIVVENNGEKGAKELWFFISHNDSFNVREHT